MTSKPFTPQEAEGVATMYLDGMDVREIARMRDRSVSSIKDKLSRMGVRRGQVRREKIRLARIKKLVSYLEDGPRVLEQILEYMPISRTQFFILREQAWEEVGAVIESDYVSTGHATYRLVKPRFPNRLAKSLTVSQGGTS